MIGKQCDYETNIDLGEENYFLNDLPVVPNQIAAYYIDDNGNLLKNYFTKMYMTRVMWKRNRDDKISLPVGEWVTMLRDCMSFEK